MTLSPLRLLTCTVIITTAVSVRAGCVASALATFQDNHHTLLRLDFTGQGSCSSDIAQTTSISYRTDNGPWGTPYSCPHQFCEETFDLGVACSPVGTHVVDVAVHCFKPNGNGCTDDNGVASTSYQIVHLAQPGGSSAEPLQWDDLSHVFWTNITTHVAWDNQNAPYVELDYDYLPAKNFAGTHSTVRGVSEDGTRVTYVQWNEPEDLMKITAVACDASGYEIISLADHQCCDTNAPPATSAADPIHVASGNMRYRDHDPIPLLPRGLDRAYDSLNSQTGAFGRGWSTAFDAWLRTVDDGNGKTIVLIGTPDNQRYAFNGSGAQYQQLWPRSSTPASLIPAGGGGYVLREYGSDEQLRFSAAGSLVQTVSVTSGRAFNYLYAQSGAPVEVDDSWNNATWTISPDPGTGLVTSIAPNDGSGTAWTYEYDSGRKLTAVKVNGAVWRSYVYSGNRLTEAHDGAGNLIESHTYASSATAEATTSVGPSGDVAAVTYNGAGRVPGEYVTTVTTTAGAVTHYYTRYIAGRPRTVQVVGGCASCGNEDAVYGYDGLGHLVLHQDARGYLTTRTFDSRGREASISGPWRPASCDPATDSSYCRLTPDTIAGTLLQSTADTITTTKTYGDDNWPDRPTQTTVTSVTGGDRVKTETWTFDATTGQVLTDSVSGYGTNLSTAEVHTTTALLYNGTETAAFAPGGAFDPAWLSAPQPAGFRKSVDGPRTDVSDITSFVYYPFAAGVPNIWRGHLAATRNAAGHITRFESYDLFGHALRVVDPNGVATVTTCDALGRTLTSTLKGVSGCDTSSDPLCATDLTTTRTYAPAAGPPATEQRPGGGTSVYEYDIRGRLAATSRGPAAGDLRERKEASYDPASGKVSQERLYARSGASWTETHRESYAYDAFARLQTATHADNSTISYTYDPGSNVVSVKDENHATANTAYAYTPASRLATVSQTLAGAPGGTIATHYAYDVQGNLASVTDPNGNVTTYAYDDFGRMLSQVSPVTGTMAYSYDMAGNLVSTTDANAATTTRTYDALGRVTQAVSARSGLDTETVTWTYDGDMCGTGNGIGRLGDMTDPAGETTYCYERRGLLASFTTADLVAFTYDADGNRTSILYPSGRTVTYGFDYADRPITAAVGGTPLVTSAAYLPYGPRTQLAFGNGTNQTTSFDSRYRPAENKLTGTSGTMADYIYAEDGDGNITQIHDGVNAAYNRDFGYDDLNRLTVANSGGSLWGNGSYHYDAMGNVLSVTAGGRNLSFSYAGSTPKVALVTGSASEASTYDAAGNETTLAGISARNLVGQVGQLIGKPGLGDLLRI